MPSTILHLFLPDRPRDDEGRPPARQLAHLLGVETSGLLTLLEESDTALTFCAQAETAPARTALLHIEQAQVEGVKTAVAVFDSRTDKKDADFVEERRVRTAQTKEDTAQAIPTCWPRASWGVCPAPSSGRR